MKKIILDTNFLMLVPQFKVDVFSEIAKLVNFPFEFAILDKTVDELDKIIEQQRGKHRDNAKIGLQLIKAQKIKKITTKGEGSVDDFIVDLASKNSYLVATQDKELKRRLKAKKVAYFVLRQKKYVALFGLD